MGDTGAGPGSPREEVLALAAELDGLRWEISPFAATMLGITGHDDRVPDVSRAGEGRFRAAAASILARTADVDAAAPAAADAVTLATLEHGARSLVAELDAGLAEFTVSPQGEGLGTILQAAAVTAPADEAGAQAHLRRVRALGGYVDGCAERLREGAAAGRFPVVALVGRTVGMLDGYLASDPEQDALATVPAPPGPGGQPWSGETGWRAELAGAVREVVRPALERYRGVVTELLPAGRGDDRPGLVHVPGGEGAYRQLVLVHTSLPLTPQALHETGLAAMARLRGEIEQVGSRLGFDGFDAVRAAAAASSAGVEAQAALEAARAAVTRAEAALPGWFAAPLPPPCRVEPMSAHLGRAGMPPHYTPPTPDGRRPGTYWFNVDQLGAGAGWDLEAVAYHEAVPGHHLQLERMLTRHDLPALQRLGVVTVHAEGWGLYAELLAQEMGLYSSDEQLLGALVTRMFRAARLVVDTGLHALGWSRSHAAGVMTENVPMAPAFVASEVDRYIAWPGQALAYYTGFEEILRLRSAARERLGERFDLAGFHAAVLDSGGVPLPALRLAVEAWATAVQAGMPVS